MEVVLVVFAFCWQHCCGQSSYSGGQIVIPASQTQTTGQPQEPVNQNDIRQHALDVGTRLTELLRQEIAFLSKISNTPIRDIDRMTTPGTAATLFPMSTNQSPSPTVVINTYSGPPPTSIIGTGQCPCRPQQSVLQPSQSTYNYNTVAPNGPIPEPAPTVPEAPYNLEITLPPEFQSNPFNPMPLQPTGQNIQNNDQPSEEPPMYLQIERPPSATDTSPAQVANPLANPEIFEYPQPVGTPAMPVYNPFFPAQVPQDAQSQSSNVNTGDIQNQMSQGGNFNTPPASYEWQKPVEQGFDITMPNINQQGSAQNVPSTAQLNQQTSQSPVSFNPLASLPAQVEATVQPLSSNVNTGNSPSTSLQGVNSNPAPAYAWEQPAVHGISFAIPNINQQGSTQNVPSTAQSNQQTNQPPVSFNPLPSLPAQVEATVQPLSSNVNTGNSPSTNSQGENLNPGPAYYSWQRPVEQGFEITMPNFNQQGSTQNVPSTIQPNQQSSQLPVSFNPLSSMSQVAEVPQTTQPQATAAQKPPTEVILLQEPAPAPSIAQ